MVVADDSEGTEQILGALKEHLTACPPATFTYQGTSGIARRKIGKLQSVIEGECLADKIRLRAPVPIFAKIH